MRTVLLLALCSCLGIGLGLPLATAQNIERAPIHYSKARPGDAVMALGEKIEAGKVKLKRDDDRGYLVSVLQHLDIPLSSQVLVFSRTSLQRTRIGPKTPRAIYFNDDVTVGFCVNGDLLEIAAADGKIGTAFYTIEQGPASRGTITRETDRCLECHGGSANRGLPGHLLRSVSADGNGEPVFSRGTRRVDHRTHLFERWGGWYVTGTSGKQMHRGNLVFTREAEPKAGEGLNVTDLKTRFNVANYLTPHSDLVALLVLDHQSEGHNRLARANLLTRLAQAEELEMNKALGRPLEQRSPAITRRIEAACEPLVQYLLFCDEAPLIEPVAGTSTFARDFTARGPFDSRGRTLREFDLRTHMFRYPLSYLIYSRAFDGLPEEAREQVYLRLWEVLTGKDQSRPFDHLSAADRQAMLEIVRDTRPGLPAYWMAKKAD